ncbi:MAG: PIN domain-containing protein [Chitinophagaceae bacterium]|nr:MAG: PIN domain-containing protein [Chitinophagaceae bacterium]
MMIDLVLDTNILIYALNYDSVNYNSAITFFLNPNYKLFITSKNISEFFGVTSKLKIPYSSSLTFYKELKNNLTVLFPSEKSLLILETLIQQYQPKGNQVYDIEIVSIMMANNIKYVATFNQKDFKNIHEIQILDI